MYKKGDLVSTTLGAHAIFLGRERTKEKFDHFGVGGLFVGQVYVLFIRDAPHWRYSTRVGKKGWIDRSSVRKLNLM